MSREKRRNNHREREFSRVEEREVKRLISQIRAGDKRAFSKLVKRYREPVAALAYRMVNDYDEAADISQDVFVKVAKNLWRYNDKKRFSTWLYRVTVNAGIDHMRKHNRHRHEPLENYREHVESAQANPAVSYQRRQLGRFIEQASELLTEKQRSAFYLRDVEGCRIGDVAVIMGMPEATVRWYLHRARSKIRKELSRRCPHLLLPLDMR